MKHYSFPHIGNFSQAMKSMRRNKQWIGENEEGYPLFDELKKLPVVRYYGTTKLHGTNTAIVFDVESKEVHAQSKNRVLKVGDDNYGFAAFVNKLVENGLVQKIMDQLDPHGEKLAIYGEWVGKGIQKKVAVCDLERSWFVFAMKTIQEGMPSSWENSRFALPDEGVYFMEDYGDHRIDIDLNTPSKSEDELNKLTTEIEASCPVGKAFGIDGCGEGVVWRPHNYVKRYDFAFKVKGAKHAETIPKAAKMVEPTSAKVIDFVRDTLTGERFEQGLALLGETGEVDIKRTGEFLGWIVKDILREEEGKLGELNIKHVKKELGKAARIKFIDYVNKV